MSSDAEAYYAAQTLALREHGATNAARLWQRHALRPSVRGEDVIDADAVPAENPDVLSG
ncbi:hypothetical protein [Streptomyces sp. NPDC087297]|uniref:hypothetical protein n=1 Tax=Streptomyces sp. NPDC087297 TaxID=3365778 RepID=UPI0037FB8673